MTESMDPNSNPENEEEEGIISLDDLDSLIATEDPEFSEQMEAISTDESLKNANVEVVNFEEAPDEIIEESKPLFLEKNPKLAKILKPLISFIQKSREKINSSIVKGQTLIFHFIDWMKSEFPGKVKSALLGSKDAFRNFLEKFKFYISKYKALPKKTRRGVWLAATFAVLMTAWIVFSLKRNWVPELSEPLYPSVAPLASEEFAIEEGEAFKSLYRAFPQPEHFFLLDKIVVNLKRTNSYENPMIYLELNLQVDSRDTAIELSDRKSQVLDVVQRSVEGFTKDELSGKAGIAKMKAAVRYDINSLLNQGRVNKVFIKRSIRKN